MSDLTFYLLMMLVTAVAWWCAERLLDKLERAAINQPTKGET